MLEPATTPLSKLLTSERLASLTTEDAVNRWRQEVELSPDRLERIALASIVRLIEEQKNAPLDEGVFDWLSDVEEIVRGPFDSIGSLLFAALRGVAVSGEPQSLLRAINAVRSTSNGLLLNVRPEPTDFFVPPGTLTPAAVTTTVRLGAPEPALAYRRDFYLLPSDLVARGEQKTAKAEADLRLKQELDKLKRERDELAAKARQDSNEASNQAAADLRRQKEEAQRQKSKDDAELARIKSEGEAEKRRLALEKEEEKKRFDIELAEAKADRQTELERLRADLRAAAEAEKRERQQKDRAEKLEQQLKGVQEEAENKRKLQEAKQAEKLREIQDQYDRQVQEAEARANNAQLFANEQARLKQETEINAARLRSEEQAQRLAIQQQLMNERAENDRQKAALAAQLRAEQDSYSAQLKLLQANQRTEQDKALAQEVAVLRADKTAFEAQLKSLQANQRTQLDAMLAVEAAALRKEKAEFQARINSLEATAQTQRKAALEAQKLREAQESRIKLAEDKIASEEKTRREIERKRQEEIATKDKEREIAVLSGLLFRAQRLIPGLLSVVDTDVRQVSTELSGVPTAEQWAAFAKNNKSGAPLTELQETITGAGAASDIANVLKPIVEGKANRLEEEISKKVSQLSVEGREAPEQRVLVRAQAELEVYATKKVEYASKLDQLELLLEEARKRREERLRALLRRQEQAVEADRVLVSQLGSGTHSVYIGRDAIASLAALGNISARPKRLRLSPAQQSPSSKGRPDPSRVAKE